MTYYPDMQSLMGIGQAGERIPRPDPFSVAQLFFGRETAQDTDTPGRKLQSILSEFAPRVADMAAIDGFLTLSPPDTFASVLAKAALKVQISVENLVLFQRELEREIDKRALDIGAAIAEWDRLETYRKRVAGRIVSLSGPFIPESERSSDFPLDRIPDPPRSEITELLAFGADAERAQALISARINEEVPIFNDLTDRRNAHVALLKPRLSGLKGFLEKFKDDFDPAFFNQVGRNIGIFIEPFVEGAEKVGKGVVAFVEGGVKTAGAVAGLLPIIAIGALLVLLAGDRK